MLKAMAKKISSYRAAEILASATGTCDVCPRVLEEGRKKISSFIRVPSIEIVIAKALYRRTDTYRSSKPIGIS
jgi:hypothetical protein